MQQTLIIGVDVSKSTLDVCFQPVNCLLQISNDLAGFKSWHQQLRSLGTFQKVLVVMEHTGSYSYQFEKFLRARSIGYCKVSALQIKRSLGITRGKTDKVDAARIADYGWLRRDILAADAEVQPIIKELDLLITARQAMVKDRSGYKNRIKLQKSTGICENSKVILKMEQEIVELFNKKIKAIEAEILAVLKREKAIYTNYQLLRSIKGVGLIIAAYMISATGNFTRFKNFRKFNCYAGLAPFAQESGSSIRGRTKVSHLANKKAKALLNLAAFCALRYDNELKTYYQKRVANGKSRMGCVNIIRSKILSRMFAVVKRQTPYEPLPIAA